PPTDIVLCHIYNQAEIATHHLVLGGLENHPCVAHLPSEQRKQFDPSARDLTRTFRRFQQRGESALGAIQGSRRESAQHTDLLKGGDHLKNFLLLGHLSRRCNGVTQRVSDRTGTLIDAFRDRNFFIPRKERAISKRPKVD